jgi:hypothetical protein
LHSHLLDTWEPLSDAMCNKVEIFPWHSGSAEKRGVVREHPLGSCLSLCNALGFVASYGFLGGSEICGAVERAIRSTGMILTNVENVRDGKGNVLTRDFQET